MREIKFRGFSKTLNKWIIGVPYFSEGNWWILVDENTKSEDIGTGSYFVDKNSIGQHTGLKDINKVEIYEGDILKSDIDEALGVVCFEDGKFVVNWENISEDLFEWTGEFIIGNIYENPELLEQEK
ncbi:YopX family protein [Aliarcobacter butzleri]|uniref:YopX family protein n=1 Tax=Aliarcobacter butzleri TaxID=28197 RepID=UPI0021B586CF|nr:YopX family protein [Aliarcobacter butzleri]MCT7643452.1 YopX family protein [Aliarcobacter butzleri]